MVTTTTNNTGSVVSALPFWKRISGRLILNSVLLAILPVIIVVTITLLLTRQQIQTQIYNQLEAVSVLKTGQIEEWIRNGHQTLEYVTNDRQNAERIIALVEEPEISVFLNATVNASLQAIAASYEFESIFVYTPQGEIIASSADRYVGRVVNLQPYFEASLTEPHTEPPYYDVGRSQLALVVSRPLYNINNQLVVIVAGTLRTETLSEIMLDRTGLGESGETYLVSLENNYFLTPSRFEGFSQNQSYFSRGIDAGLAGEIGVAQYPGYRNVGVYGSYRWLPEIESVLLAEIDAAEANSVVLQLLVFTIGIMVLTVVVAIGFGLFSALRLSRPIEALAHVAQNIAQGDLTQRANVDSSDEIGVLANSFNSMTEQLNFLIENLEQRVQERTRDLSIASEVSQQVTRVLDMKQLLPYLANLTKEGFDLSHVSVFVYDTKTDLLRLQAGSGKVGQKMLEQGKQFQLNDKGLVPLAARTYEPQIINDVTQSPNHFANPLLPETRSEIAVPMRVGTQLIGVLDLQSNEPNHFAQEQVNVMTALADQIAVAVRNAQLFQFAEASRKEAEQANVVKSQFLAAMSHELRTPLNAVLNFTQFVSTGMLGDVNAEQVDMLDKVVQSGKHLLSLINDVLDISKIEAGALKLFIEEGIDMRAESETAVAAAKGLLAEKPVELITDIAADLPLVVGDKRRLRQIMLNLVSNACKFTEEGEVRISIQPEGESIRFAVTDTGPGIAKEDYELIFETFRQSNTGLRQGEGTGLGLPISRRLAEAHGGRLWLESTIGAGTTFYFTIPVHNPELIPVVKRKETNHAV
jgi:signal transduction histidine kinase/HAMP domain-containing protein